MPVISRSHSKDRRHPRSRKPVPAQGLESSAFPAEVTPNGLALEIIRQAIARRDDAARFEAKFNRQCELAHAAGGVMDDPDTRHAVSSQWDDQYDLVRRQSNFAEEQLIWALQTAAGLRHWNTKDEPEGEAVVLAIDDLLYVLTPPSENDTRETPGWHLDVSSRCVDLENVA